MFSLSIRETSDFNPMGGRDLRYLRSSQELPDRQEEVPATRLRDPRRSRERRRASSRLSEEEEDEEEGEQVKRLYQSRTPDRDEEALMLYIRKINQIINQ